MPRAAPTRRAGPAMNDQTRTLLVVDDDADLRGLVAAHLRLAGYAVRDAADLSEARAALAAARPDLVVLDVVMPGGSGVDLCREIAAASGPPVILLTSIGAEADRVRGLDAGADDYVTKPFAPAELLARIRAVLRRASPARGTGHRARIGPWTFDRVQAELTGSDDVVRLLSTGEARLLSALVDAAGETLSRDALLQAMQGREARPFERSVDIAVARLRRKIEVDPADPRLLKTVRGAGYRLAVPAEPG